MSDPDIACYHFRDIGLNQSCGYRLSAVSRMLDELTVPSRDRQLFALGCRNGSVTYELTRCGWDLTGIDPGVNGIDEASRERIN
jgi:hypothetical protein